MKKSIVLLSVVWLSIFSSGKAQTIEFTFTATSDTAWVQLDSIEVKNLKQGGDTSLIYPDTVLVLEYTTGLQDSKFSENNFAITAFYPNPVSEKAMLQLFIPERDLVEIRVTDFLSKQMLFEKVYLDAGIQSFTIIPGQKGVFFIIVTWRGLSDNVVLISTGENSSEVCRLMYQNRSGISLKNYPTKRVQSFSYSAGDVLWYIGYRDTTQAGIIDIPDASTTYSFLFAPPEPCPGIPTVLYEGQMYNTAQVGSQCWLRENLNVGTMIYGDVEMTNNGIIEKYCYDNDQENCSVYGGLYQWDEAVQYTTQPGAQGICPPGWHLPTNDELIILTDFLGGYSIAGGKMKEAGNIHWESPNIGATNESGLTALPAGCLDPINHTFININSALILWSSSETNSPTLVWYRGLSSYEAKCSDGFSSKPTGYSVRCLKD